jgi:hypothetical protein
MIAALISRSGLHAAEQRFGARGCDQDLRLVRAVPEVVRELAAAHLHALAVVDIDPRASVKFWPTEYICTTTYCALGSSTVPGTPRPP